MGIDQKKALAVPRRMYLFIWFSMAALTGVGYFSEWLTGFSSGGMDKFAIALGVLAVLLFSLRATLGPIRKA